MNNSKHYKRTLIDMQGKIEDIDSYNDKFVALYIHVDIYGVFWDDRLEQFKEEIVQLRNDLRLFLDIFDNI